MQYCIKYTMGGMFIRDVLLTYKGRSPLEWILRETPKVYLKWLPKDQLKIVLGVGGWLPSTYIPLDTA